VNQKNYYKWQEDNLLLELYIQPKASKDAIIGEYGERLKVAITQAPQDGKANKHLIKFLAKHFGVPQNHIELLKGDSSKYKSVLIYSPRQNFAQFPKDHFLLYSSLL